MTFNFFPVLLLLYTYLFPLLSQLLPPSFASHPARILSPFPFSCNQIFLYFSLFTFQVADVIFPFCNAPFQTFKHKNALFFCLIFTSFIHKFLQSKHFPSLIRNNISSLFFTKNQFFFVYFHKRKKTVPLTLELSDKPFLFLSSYIVTKSPYSSSVTSV